MLNNHLIRRALVTGLVFGAAGLPTAAQAMSARTGPGGVGTAAPVPRGLSAQQRLDQLQTSVRNRFAAQGGWPAAAATAATAPTAQGGFQWGDAGIGAAGATLLLGAGAAGAGLTRRRRVQRPAIG